MNDQEKTREQLIAELVELRQRVAESEAARTSLDDGKARWQSHDPRWQSLVAHTPVFILILDQDQRICFANHTDSGGAINQIMGKPLHAFCRPEDRERVQKCVEQVFQTGHPGLCEGPGMRLDNQEHWYASHFGPIFEQGRVIAVSVISINVTDRKRAETALQESEERFRRIFEEGPLGVILASLDGRIHRVNRRFCDLLGYSEREITELGIKGFSHPDDYQLDERLAARLLRGEIPCYTLDKRFFRKDGQLRWGQVTVSLMRDAEGKPTHAIGMTEDITARKLAEQELQQAKDRLEQRILERTAELTRANETLQAEVKQRRQAEEFLRQSEVKYRALVESCPDAVAMLDLQGRVIFASQRTAEQHGVLRPDELMGSQATDFVVKAERDKFRASIGRLIREGVHRNVEYTLLRQDGTTFDAEVSSAVIRDATGNPEALMAVYRDISERKRAEEVIRQSHDELQTIHDGIIEGLLITDIETKRFIRVNASFCRMLGYSEQELLAASIQDIHPPEEVPNDLRRFQEAAEGRVRINEDRPVLRKDGSIFYADIAGHRIFYDERPCLLALFRDVTERRQAEAKLKAEQRALRRMLLASDHERQLITYELHDGVAQQLMGAILHFQSQEPREGRSSKTADAYREGLVALRQASLEIRSVMSRLRTPVLDMYGLIEAIRDVASQWRLVPDAPEIEYHQAVTFERLEPTLENALFRIAQEAMTNACRHSKSKKVQLKLTQHDGDVTLEVQDWGIGFDQDTVQANRFGLEGIRERCRILGGNLSIESELGQGTIVRAKFPVIEAAGED
jgi:PAS domain S-box-containing protein